MTTTRYAVIPSSAKPDDVINQYLKNNPSWELASISHNVLPNGVSVFLVFKHKGQNLDAVMTELPAIQ